MPRKGKGFIRGNALGVPGQPHSPQMHNLNVHDNPSANSLDMPQAQMHKMYMNTSRDKFQRFRPYFNMDEVEQDTQYDVTDEHRRLVQIPLMVISGIILYFLYRRYMTYVTFFNIDDHISKLKRNEFDIKGMLLVEATKSKFDDKYLSREDYHKWLENDIRQFK